MHAFLVGLLVATASAGAASVSVDEVNFLHENLLWVVNEKERAKIQARFDELIGLAQAEISASGFQPALSQLGALVIRKFGPDEPLALANVLGKLPSGVFLAKLLSGETVLYPPDRVYLQKVDLDLPHVRASDQIGVRFAFVDIGPRRYWVVCDLTWHNGRIVPEGFYPVGRRPEPHRELIALTGPHGGLRVKAPSFVYDDQIVEVEGRLYNTSTARLNPELPQAQKVTPHPERLVWMPFKGQLWRYRSIGRFGSDAVVRGKKGHYFVVKNPIWALESSQLVGQTAVRRGGARSGELLRVAHALEDGSVVSSLGEVLRSSEFDIENVAPALERLADRRFFEKLVDLILWVPRNISAAVTDLYRRLRVKSNLRSARREAPGTASNILVLNSADEIANNEKTFVGQRLIAGNGTEILVRGAELLARKYGVRTYVGKTVDSKQIDAPKPPDAFVQTSNYHSLAMFRSPLDKYTWVHELTHVHTSFAEIVLRRKHSRRTTFRVSLGRGFKFFENQERSGYPNYFRADEVHARAAEIRLAIGDLERSPPIDQDERTRLTSMVNKLLSESRAFLIEMEDEMDRMREAIAEDHGKNSVRWYWNRLKVVRPLTVRSATEDPQRSSQITFWGPTWFQNRERRVRSVLELFDGLTEENNRMSRVLNRLQKRFKRATASNNSACETGLASDDLTNAP